MMKETSEKLAAKLAKEHPELGIKPHTHLRRYTGKMKWYGTESVAVWSARSMTDYLNNKTAVVVCDGGCEVVIL